MRFCFRYITNQENKICCLVGFMVFNATLKNISVTSWQSVLLVEETRVPQKTNGPVTNH